MIVAHINNFLRSNKEYQTATQYKKYNFDLGKIIG